MDKPKKTPKINQAMVEAYDEYTHLTLDRRAFMDKLAKLAGSGAAAAVIAPMLAANSAQAAVVASDDPRLLTKDVIHSGPSGDMKGYSVRLSDTTEKLPVVVVIHENRGLNDHIRDIARRMALEGFTVFAPDFLSSVGGTPSDEDKARDLIANLDPNKTIAEGVATISSLKEAKYANGKVGVMGFAGAADWSMILLSMRRSLTPAWLIMAASQRPRTWQRSRRRCFYTMPGWIRGSMRALMATGRLCKTVARPSTSKSMKARTTHSTMIRQQRVTARKRLIWPGAGLSHFSKNI